MADRVLYDSKGVALYSVRRADLCSRANQKSLLGTRHDVHRRLLLLPKFYPHISL